MSGVSKAASQIADSVSQVNTKVLGDAPAVPMSFLATSAEGRHPPGSHPHRGADEHDRGGPPRPEPATATPGLQLDAAVDQIEAEADAGSELDP